MVPFSALGCPYCQGPLRAVARAGGPLQCRDCGQQFATEGRIPVLLRHEDAERFAAFSAEYRQARLDEGWRPLSPETALALPCGQPPGCPRLYWQVRHQSFAALMGLLAREGPTPAHGPAADLGAGTGWLSYRLAQLGYEVLAVDASADADFGLGAAARLYLPHAPFALVQGDLEHPPLERDALGLIVDLVTLGHVGFDLAHLDQLIHPRVGIGGVVAPAVDLALRVPGVKSGLKMAHWVKGRVTPTN